MIKRLIKALIFGVFLASSGVYAEPGPLFKITQSGSPLAVDIVLCLNGKGPLSCQNYRVLASNLTIAPTLARVYPAAGIRVLTPGYVPTGCTPFPNGYCLFVANPQSPVTVILNGGQPPTPPKAYTVGGVISGLTSSVTLQNNGGETLTQTTNGDFGFPTPITQGVSYNVTVLTQRTNL